MAYELLISNDFLKVTISTMGAELTSVKKNGEEQIWIGDPEIWNEHAPLLFPICGALKENRYIYKGTEYNLNLHGYARFTEFDVESYTKKKVVFLHRYNNDTLKVFPFQYELRVIYTLDGTSLKIDYNIKNLDKEKMYFSIGSHEAYYCPEGIEEYSVIFETAENLEYNNYTKGLLDYTTESFGDNITELPLKYEYFSKISLTFLNLRSKRFTLLNRKTGRKIEVKIDDNPSSFTLFSRPGRQYMCLEPWCGMTDYVDTDYDFKNKKGIVTLGGYDEKTISHEIIF